MAEDYSFDAQLLKEMRRLKGLLPCCPNCEHWVTHVVFNQDNSIVKDSEACGLDPQRRMPPADIVAFGCPAFRPGIPF